MQTIDSGNNEKLSYGIYENSDGTFTAVTFSRSRTFKTFASATKWLVKINAE